MKILKETTVGQIADEMNAEVENDADDIKETLDEILEANLDAREVGSGEVVNLLLTGAAGVGKTARVVQWAKENDINLYRLDAQSLDVTDMGGAIVPDKTGTAIQRLTNKELEKLNEPRSVLFLDEYNRARSEVRATLLTLINDHVYNDATTKSGKKYLPNFLFTVAAINPSNASYNTFELDQAERERFYELGVEPNKMQYLKYLMGKYDEEYERAKESGSERLMKKVEGKRALAQTILMDKDFHFDGEKEAEQALMNNTSTLSPRSFSKVLELSKGKKDLLLKYWNGQCGPSMFGIVKQALANYQDVDDKANDALKQDTESNVFATRSKTASSIDAIGAWAGIE